MSDVGLASVRLGDWAVDDLELLRRVDAPDMTAFLGGPETDEQVVARHRRYLAIPLSGTGRMFRVTLLPEEITAGTIGYRQKQRREETVYSAGRGRRRIPGRPSHPLQRLEVGSEPHHPQVTMPRHISSAVPSPQTT